VIGGCGGQHSGGLGGDDGRGAEVSGVANVRGGGSGFVGSDGGSETVSVSHVVDTSGSAIGILDGIGADFVAMSVTLLFPSVLGAPFVYDIITEGIVSPIVLASAGHRLAAGEGLR
jgi:hypothetical protein